MNPTGASLNDDDCEIEPYQLTFLSLSLALMCSLHKATNMEDSLHNIHAHITFYT